MLELLACIAVAVAALIIRRRHLRTKLHDVLPVSFDRRVDAADGVEQFLARRAGATRDVRPLLRPLGAPGKRSHAVVVEVDGVPVGHLTRGDAGRYRARHGDAVTTCRGRVVRPSLRGSHELWVELHL